jgi:hypothetical protein
VFLAGTPLHVANRGGASSCDWKRKVANGALAVCNVHGPARVLLQVALGHLSNDALAESARCTVIPQSDRTIFLAAAAITIVH